jgi:hypothetical protein
MVQSRVRQVARFDAKWRWCRNRSSPGWSWRGNIEKIILGWIVGISVKDIIFLVFVPDQSFALTLALPSPLPP